MVQGILKGSSGDFILRGKNLLSVRFPEVYTQIHADYNAGVDTSTITYGSSKLLTWLCRKCGHVWEASPNSRVSSGKVHKCPKCRDCGTIKKCEYCGVVVEKFTKKVGEYSGVCTKCWSKHFQKRENCSKCGSLGRIVFVDGRARVCFSCYEKEYRPKYTCVYCGKKRVTNKVLEDGSRVCKICYRKHCGLKERCSVCDVVKSVSFRDGEKPVCTSCYHKHFRKTEKCSICGNMRPVNRADNGVIYCSVCYKKEVQLEVACVVCEKLCKPVKNVPDGAVCMKCYQREFRRKEECFICKKIGQVKKKTDLGPLCNACYTKSRYKFDEKFRTIRKLRERVRFSVKRLGLSGSKIRKFKNSNVDYEGIVEFLGPQPGSDYHIDHIFPISAFDLSVEAQFKAAVAPENHQWLPAAANLSKNDSYDRAAFSEYLKKYK